MTVRSVVLVLLSILAAIFLILNWQGIMAPVPVNFIFGEVQAPLSLILLIVLGVLWVAGIAWSLMSQASTLLEIRRAYKEANANKTLANHAELSRTEQMKKTLQDEMSGMQGTIIAEIQKISSSTDASLKASEARVAALEESVRVLTARFDKLAHEAGIDLSPEAHVEPRRGFFGLFSGAEKERKTERTLELHKAADPAAVPAPAAAPAIEAAKPATQGAAASAPSQKKTAAAEPAHAEASGTGAQGADGRKKGLFGKIFH